MKKHVLVHQNISWAYGMNEKSKVFKYLHNLFFIVDKCLRESKQTIGLHFHPLMVFQCRRIHADVT